MCVTIWNNSEVKLLLCNIDADLYQPNKNESINSSNFTILTPSFETSPSFEPSSSSSFETSPSFEPSSSFSSIKSPSVNSQTPSPISKDPDFSEVPSPSSVDSKYSLSDELSVIDEIMNTVNATNMTNLTDTRNKRDIYITQPNDLLHLFWLLLLLIPIGFLFLRNKKKSKICPQPKHKLYKAASAPNLGVIPSAPPLIMRSSSTGDLKPTTSVNYTSALKNAVAETRPLALNTSQESSKTEETTPSSPHPPLPVEIPPVNQKNLPKLPQKDIDLESGGQLENE